MKSFVFKLILLFFPAALCVGQPYSGNLTIDQTQPTGGTNFNSFTNLANNLLFFGISGNVTITVVPGTGPYVEQVEFLPIPGTGPNAMVFLEGSGEELRCVTTSTERYVLRLNNQTYFTVNNLKVSRDPASTGGFYGIHIFGTGNHITISNCEADISGTTSTLYGGFVASGSETSILETGDFHNISFNNNKSTGGGYGISLFGLLSNLASNISITNNELLDFHSNGIYLRETNGVVVSGNYLRKSTSNVTTANAIQLAQAANINGQIYNNVIEFDQPANGSMTLRGIYLFNGTGHKVYNNVIHSAVQSSGDIVGIEVRTGGTAPQICFNTILIDPATPTSGDLAGISEELSNTQAVIRNNVISITQPTSGAKSALALASNSNVATAFISNFNDFWVPGGNIAQKGGGITTPVFYTSLSSWQSTSGQDMSSLNADPVPAGSAMPVPTNPAIDNLGISIPFVTEDILGVLRSNPPDMGAYEFSPGPPAAPGPIQGDTTVCDNVLVQSYEVMPVAGASTYTWSVDPGMQILSGQGTPYVVISAGSGGILSVFATNISGNSAVTSTTISILPAPVVSLNLPVDTLCTTSQPYLLSGGIPAGGQFSGTAVSAGVFTAALAGVGLHPVMYTYMAPNGCINTDTAQIAVEICPGLPEFDSKTIRISPNPCRRLSPLSIHCSSVPLSLMIFNSEGRLVYANSSSEVIQNGLYPDIEAGVYQMVIRTAAQEVLFQKLIILP